MMAFSLVVALLAALPKSCVSISMCCVGDWTSSPGPYAGFDTSTSTAAFNQEMDVGCDTCCQGYDSGTKYGRIGTDLVFQVVAPGIFTAGYGIGGGAVAGDATLRVEFSQEQVLMNADSVNTVYKRSTFDPEAWNTRTGTCASGVAPGFRFGTYGRGLPSLSDGVLVSGSPAIEFEQDMVWKNTADNAVLGSGWGMQQVLIGAQNVPGHRDTRCFHTDADKLTGCTDTSVSENGIKFQLELNQQGSYPHGVSTFWDACTSDGGDDATCATCFAVAVTVDKGAFTVSEHRATDEAVSWTLLDASNNETYDFTFAFENLYNRNDQGNGIDSPSNFHTATVLTSTSAASGSVYVCALKGDFDPSDSDQHVVFLYDPEVRVSKSGEASAAPSAAPSAAFIIATFICSIAAQLVTY